MENGKSKGGFLRPPRNAESMEKWKMENRKGNSYPCHAMQLPQDRAFAKPHFGNEGKRGENQRRGAYRWQRGHQRVVRPPIVAVWSSRPSRGQMPSSVHRW